MRVHWMLHELDLPYQTFPIKARSGETQTDSYLDINPKGKIPVLEDDTLVLTESVAIVTYLGDTYGKDSGLIPVSNTIERARYNEWCAFIQMELDAHTLYVLRKHRDLAAQYGEAPAAVTTAIEGFRTQVQVADAALKETNYLVGDRFTAADIIMTTTLKWAIAYEVALTPRLIEYTDFHAARPAYLTAGRLTFSISSGA